MRQQAKEGKKESEQLTKKKEKNKKGTKEPTGRQKEADDETKAFRNITEA